jgi:hypothetical protein
VVPGTDPGGRTRGQRSDAVDQRAQDRVGRPQVLDPGLRSGYACPSTAPGTPVFVEYFGWIRVSGRIACTAWETAIAASA